MIRDIIRENNFNNDELVSYLIDTYKCDDHIVALHNAYFETYDSKPEKNYQTTICQDIRDIIAGHLMEYVDNVYLKNILKVGDVVRVKNWGDRYDSYLEWFEKHHLEIFKDAYIQTNNKPLTTEKTKLQYKITAIANHTRWTDVRPLVLVCDMLNNYYLIDMDAVEKWESE